MEKIKITLRLHPEIIAHMITGCKKLGQPPRSLAESVKTIALYGTSMILDPDWALTRPEPESLQTLQSFTATSIKDRSSEIPSIQSLPSNPILAHFSPELRPLAEKVLSAIEAGYTTIEENLNSNNPDLVRITQMIQQAQQKIKEK